MHTSFVNMTNRPPVHISGVIAWPDDAVTCSVVTFSVYFPLKRLPLTSKRHLQPFLSNGLIRSSPNKYATRREDGLSPNKNHASS